MVQISRKKMFKVVGSAFACLFIFSSCSEDVYDASYRAPSPMPDLVTPSTFDWQTTQTVRLTAITNDAYQGKYNYEVSVYETNPLTDDNAQLLTLGLAKEGKPYVENLTLSKNIQSVYVCQTMKMKDGTKQTVMKVIPVENGEVLCDFTNASYDANVPAMAKTREVTVRATDKEEPSDEDLKSAIEIEGSNFTIKNSKKYVVSKGKTFTGYLNWSDISNVTIYIAGTFAPSNEQELNNKSTMYVLSGGEYKVSKLSINSNARFNNYGKTIISNLQVDDPGSIVSNYSQMNLDKLTLISNSQLQNYCFIGVSNFLDIQGNRDVVVGPEAMLLCKDLKMNNSTIKLDNNAIFKVTGNASFIFNNNIQADDPSSGAKITALALFNKMKVEWGGLSLLGRLQAFFKDIDNSSLGNISTQQKVTIAATEDATIQIDPSGCNGEGNNNKKPEPGGSDYPIIVSPTGNHTLLMEDNWPSYGDYDMNDFVMDVKRAYTDQGSYISDMTITAKLRAVGATKKISAAVQLDNVNADNVTSVTYKDGTKDLDGSVFVLENGVEKNQQKAVIPFFDDAHKAMGVSDHKPINTIVGSELNTKELPEYVVTVSFKPNTVKKEDIAIMKQNFFIVTDGNKINRREVHLRGFEPTQLLNRKLLNANNDAYSVAPYSSNDNLIWGLMLPSVEGVTYSYPNEYHNIKTVYTSFASWATSNGTSDKDWYKKEKANKSLLFE